MVLIGRSSMACYHPWWKDRQVLPCGQCRGCRAAYHREWSARCVHEACMHEVNSFVTLTYDDEHLPVGGSLDLEAVPVLIRALRKRGKKVRYFYCGEYGERSGRPHYHALLVGEADDSTCRRQLVLDLPVAPKGHTWVSSLAWKNLNAQRVDGLRVDLAPGQALSGTLEIEISDKRQI